jgi:orotidine-5'-phosphate decarboxylase
MASRPWQKLFSNRYIELRNEIQLTQLYPRRRGSHCVRPTSSSMGTDECGERWYFKDMNRIIIALDVPSANEARKIVDVLGNEINFYKVGLQLLTAAGPQYVNELITANKKVFLDLKLFEIPNSVSNAVKAAGDLGVSMVTVHASGGRKIMEAAVQAAEAFANLEVLALTVVTSLTNQDLIETGIYATCEQQVLRLAKLARESGCDGLIASPAELPMLRDFSSEMTLVTPGIRLGASDDKRSDTPQTALKNGASYIIMGRSVLDSENPRDLVRTISAT